MTRTRCFRAFFTGMHSPATERLIPNTYSKLSQAVTSSPRPFFRGYTEHHHTTPESIKLAWQGVGIEDTNRTPHIFASKSIISLVLFLHIDLSTSMHSPETVTFYRM